MNLDNFLESLDNCSDHMELIDFCRKTILHGTPKIFESRENDFYEFRKRIANKFEILFHEVYITGSAQLGFSPLKKKEFDYDSDIDVALVSNDLFNKFMEIIRGYQMNYRRHRDIPSEKELKKYHEFLEYTALGWIRPDLLPLSFQIKNLKNEWFEFFNSISYNNSEVGDYKVSAGIFKSYYHLEEYTLSGLKTIKKFNELG